MSYIPEDVFDVALCTLVKIRIGASIQHDEFVKEYVNEVARGSSETWKSEDFRDLKRELIEAVSLACDGIKKLEIEDKTAVAYCEFRSHFFKNFTRDGKKRAFSREREAHCFTKVVMSRRESKRL